MPKDRIIMITEMRELEGNLYLVHVYKSSAAPSNDPNGVSKLKKEWVKDNEISKTSMAKLLRSYKSSIEQMKGFKRSTPELGTWSFIS